MRKFNHCLIFAGPVLALMIGASPLAQAQTHEDKSFVTDAAQGGMDEVRLGQMAEQNATNPQVRAFGKKMVEDHMRLNDDLQGVASRNGYKLPDDISIKQKASAKMLSAKSGNSFDDSYISTMVKDHREDVQAFEKEANSGQDPQIKMVASKALPILREHLRMAEDLARQLGVKV